MAKNKTYVGTQLKMLISFSYSGDNTLKLDDFAWDAEFYCDEKKTQCFHHQANVRQSTGGLIRETSTVQDATEINWFAAVDTLITGQGSLKMKFTAYLPDQSYPNHTRKEVAICNTNVVIE